MVEVTGGRIPLERLEVLARGGGRFRLAPEARSRMEASRAVVEAILLRDETVYGVNTGFGKLADTRIPPERLARLQLNLVRSHACGLGDALERAEVRAMLLLRANVLALGLSGARPVVAETLLSMLTHDVLPLVPSRGSVGASGDLAPLAHLALGVIGEGQVLGADGDREPAGDALARAGIAPLELQAKEGLALLNGTQAIVAVGGLALARARRVVEAADYACAMSLEALLGTPTAYDPRIHEARPHPGQGRSAARLRRMLEGSEIRESHREGDPRVQDAYSLRCAPQVHGAVADAIESPIETLERETGAATDNPLVFADTGEVLSGGNFHGAPLAYALDGAAIVLTDLMGIVERRIERLVNPDFSEGLPAFLASDPGLESGLMIPQVVAAALLNEARVLAHPASVDNVPTSAGKEDHVSMGMTSALKLKRVVEAAERVLAIELFAAAEALARRRPLRAGKGVEELFARVRRHAPPLGGDRPTSADFEALALAVRDGALTGIIPDSKG